MRSVLALLLAALLLLASAGGAAAKPAACKNLRMSTGSFVGQIVPKCMPNFSLVCSKSCRTHLKKASLACFSALIKERMPQRLDGSIRFYRWADCLSPWRGGAPRMRRPAHACMPRARHALGRRCLSIAVQ